MLWLADQEYSLANFLVHKSAFYQKDSWIFKYTQVKTFLIFFIFVITFMVLAIISCLQASEPAKIEGLLTFSGFLPFVCWMTTGESLASNEGAITFIEYWSEDIVMREVVLGKSFLGSAQMTC